MQSTTTILMVRPRFFNLNEQTMVNNYYQMRVSKEVAMIAAQAAEEFDGAVAALRKNGVEVLVLDDRPGIVTPDSIFPNNWFSTHENGRLIYYPMFAPNRRAERRSDLQDFFKSKNLHVSDFVNWSFFEGSERFLEGTGSLVLDRVHQRAYASLSARTNRELVEEWCELNHYAPYIFHAFQSIDGERRLVYHTNVVMSIGTQWALICPEALDIADEREVILSALREGRELICISEEAMGAFAGNILELKSTTGETIIVMSHKAYSAINSNALTALEQYGKVVVLNIPTIETVGGGSARCMIAEVFLPKS